MSLKQNIAVKVVAGYVAVSFVIMEILYLGVWCRPFHQYWAVPPENGTHNINGSGGWITQINNRVSTMLCGNESFDYEYRFQYLD
jgi:hypothetical protein